MNIEEIMKVSSFFPIFVMDEDNQMIMDEVSKEELHTIFSIFLKK